MRWFNWLGRLVELIAVNVPLDGMSLRLVVAVMPFGRLGKCGKDAGTGNDREPAFCRKHKACRDRKAKQQRQQNEHGARSRSPLR